MSWTEHKCRRSWKPSCQHYLNVWYIPHHGIYHPKKQRKICVVFDCAAEFEGESLNKNLLQGPDLTKNTLQSSIFRFRREPVGFMWDLESIFLQVYISEEHRDLLRLLWWEGSDVSAERFWGDLKRTAQNNEREFVSTTAEFLHNNF